MIPQGLSARQLLDPHLPFGEVGECVAILFKGLNHWFHPHLGLIQAVNYSVSSPVYQQALTLRDQVLRQPLGLSEDISGFGPFSPFDSRRDRTLNQTLSSLLSLT